MTFSAGDGQRSMPACLPLAGIRVVDFSWVAAGPTTTRILGDSGAEVIVVESGKRSGGLRGQPPFRPGYEGPNVNPWFNNCNVNKLSLTVDLSLPRAQELMRRLIARTDVVVDNFRPGVMDRWGLSYQALVPIKPDIIVVTMPMHGSTGPLRSWGGFGGAALSMSGIHDLTGFPDGPPLTFAGAFNDNSAPFHAVVAILAALYHRRETGEGQWIDLSQTESAMASIGPALLDASVNQRQAERVGNREGTAAPSGIYRCAGQDRWCAVEVHTSEEWAALCSVAEHPDWAVDPRFATAFDRWRNRQDLDEAVENWTRLNEAEEVMARLQGAGVPAGIVQDASDLLTRDPQLRARQHFIPQEHPEAGLVPTHRFGFRLSETPLRCGRAPLLGEHNYQVFHDIVGLSEREIEELIGDGVIA